MEYDVLIADGNLDLMIKSLNENKIILTAIELGENGKKSIASGFSEYFKANVKLKGTSQEGVCFCKKPATHYVYFWR